MTPEDLKELLEQSALRGYVEDPAFMQHAEACQLLTRDCKICLQRAVQESIGFPLTDRQKEEEEKRRKELAESEARLREFWEAKD